MLNDEFSTLINNENNIHPDEKEIVIPVLEEFVSVSKKKVETASVTVTKNVLETTESVDVVLQSETYNIERTVINQYVDEDNLPIARQEGDTLILPVIKEVIVKRMLLTEEVRITKKTSCTSVQQSITLRSETVDVKRIQATEE